MLKGTNIMRINISKKDNGFTIIEVLIVLAIAGLIMAVVLLAVPGLQRSQANSAAKTDASHIAAAASDWSSNNSGVSLTTTTQLSDIYNNVGTLSKLLEPGTQPPAVTAFAAPLTSASTSATITSGWYLSPASAITGVGTLLTATAFTKYSPFPWVTVIDAGVTCENATNNAALSGTSLTLTAGSSSNIAILFTTETSGAPDWNCLQAQ
ncbi:MAG TPA: type II secretion system protein [Candidatus Saccharimonadales bacterium]|jgi:prepilin-type N-terminal cleavage/methylation domain-containing protein|nr:type II secretion system protein [Candidatus Saccharimonadales bacterium]